MWRRLVVIPQTKITSKTTKGSHIYDFVLNGSTILKLKWTSACSVSIVSTTRFSLKTFKKGIIYMRLLSKLTRIHHKTPLPLLFHTVQCACLKDIHLNSRDSLLSEPYNKFWCAWRKNANYALVLASQFFCAFWRWLSCENETDTRKKGSYILPFRNNNPLYCNVIPSRSLVALVINSRKSFIRVIKPHLRIREQIFKTGNATVWAPRKRNSAREVSGGSERRPSMPTAVVNLIIRGAARVRGNANSLVSTLRLNC